MLNVVMGVCSRGARLTFGHKTTLFSAGQQIVAFVRHFSTTEDTKPISTRKPKIPSKKNLNFSLPLQSGHSIKKRVPKDSFKHDPEGFLDISCYGLSQLIDLQELNSDLSVNKFYRFPSLPPELKQEVLLVSSSSSSKTSGSHDQWDAFIFRNGVVVFWNMPEVEHSAFLDKLRNHSQGIEESDSIEQEALRFRYTEQTTRIVGEDILLQTYESRSPELLHSDLLDKNSAYTDRFPETLNSETTQTKTAALISTIDPVLLEKFAFSDALALSVKLSHLELNFDAVAIEIEQWIANLKSGSRTNFTQSAVLRKTGELYTLRHLLNVGTSLIETPDFYWERPQIEQLFQQLKSILSVSSRTRILNSRLDICCELTEILSNHLRSRHASRLEWMIIALILVEVGFEAFYYYERRQNRTNSSSSADGY